MIYSMSFTNKEYEYVCASRFIFTMLVCVNWWWRCKWVDICNARVCAGVDIYNARVWIGIYTGCVCVCVCRPLVPRSWVLSLGRACGLKPSSVRSLSNQCLSLVCVGVLVESRSSAEKGSGCLLSSDWPVSLAALSVSLGAAWLETAGEGLLPGGVQLSAASKPVEVSGR